MDNESGQRQKEDLRGLLRFALLRARDVQPDAQGLSLAVPRSLSACRASRPNLVSSRRSLFDDHLNYLGAVCFQTQTRTLVSHRSLSLTKLPSSLITPLFANSGSVKKDSLK